MKGCNMDMPMMNKKMKKDMKMPLMKKKMKKEMPMLMESDPTDVMMGKVKPRKIRTINKKK
jgi:hypothetical protein